MQDIGAEHGEGFETFRPGRPLKVDVVSYFSAAWTWDPGALDFPQVELFFRQDYLNDRMRERGLQRIRYAMKPDEAFGLIYSWDNVLVSLWETLCRKSFS